MMTDCEAVHVVQLKADWLNDGNGKGHPAKMILELVGLASGPRRKQEGVREEYTS